MAEEQSKVSNFNYKNERTYKVSFVFLLALCAVLIGLDQLTKYLAFHGSFGSFLNALSPYVRKFHYFNHNFAFSLPLPAAVIFILYAAILFVIAWYLFKHGKQLPALAKFAWVLILAGAVSNIAERVVLGYVRDYIYILTGIFNLADGYIILGILILLFASINKAPSTK